MTGLATHFDSVVHRTTCWCGVWWIGTAVIHGGRNAHVVTVPRLLVPDDHVPIMLDETSRDAIVVPLEELTPRFPNLKTGDIQVVPDTP